MKYLITGIEGFVGGYLVDEIYSDKTQIFGTYFDENMLQENVTRRCSLKKVDVTKKNEIDEAIKEACPDIIFHLAAQSSAGLSWKRPQMTMEINIIGLVNLLESIKENRPKCRLVLIGSSEQYGIVSEDENPISEFQLLRPGNPYSVSKGTCEELAKLYVASYDLDIVMTRSFNHIGNRQATMFVMADFTNKIAQIMGGKCEKILSVGNLNAKRDFSDVRDVVAAYDLISKKGIKGEVYNVGSGKCNSIQHYVDYMIQQSKMDIQVQVDKTRMRPSDNPVIVCDNAKLKALGWQPKHDIYNTIDEMIKYHKANLG